MASDVKECKSWGIIGCGWLGLSFAREKTSMGHSVWGTSQSHRGTKILERHGIQSVLFSLESPHHAGSPWPEWDVLVIALPPGASAHTERVAALRKRMDASQWNVVISSTSVYPSEPGVYDEGDAERRISPHSGMCVLDVETQWAGQRTTLLRAGGLIGPGRHLFRNAQGPRQPDRWVNVVHQNDVVRAISHVVQSELSGPVNVSAPVHRTWNECWAHGQPAGSLPLPEKRAIHVRRLIDSGFVFQHPDPAHMPDLFT